MHLDIRRVARLMAIPLAAATVAGLAVSSPARAATDTEATPPVPTTATAGTSADAAALDTPAVATALARQSPTWQECYPGAGFPQLECAGVQVPKDWSKPRGERITIAVSRVKASDPAQRRGVLFTNPGGPGGPGLTLGLYLSLVEPELAATYDLIGIDPRGVGSSTPVLECADPAILGELYNLDGRDVSAANQKRFLELNKKYASTCSADPLTRYIRTDQVVRDFDLIRSVLRERKISYVGYSAGTWLGAWYGAVFPHRVDRFMLDGIVDFTSNSYSSAVRQPRGFQKSYESYLLPWIAEHDDVYELGGTGDVVKKTIEARRAALASAPMTLAGGGTLTAAGYDSGIVGALYWTGLYDSIATALSILERYDSATDEEKAAVAEVFGGDGGLGYDPFWAVSCQDDTSPSYQRILDDTRRFRVSAPLTGATWNAYPCPFWSGRPSRSPVDGDDLPRMLLVNNDADPATPLGNALAARRNTPRSVLITVRNQPDHTIYASGAPCVEEIVNNWLINGVFPRRDTTCAGLPLPEPEPAGTASAADGAARAATAAPGQVPAQIWVDRFVKRHGAARIR
ncbi:MAG: alpha/beta fold hydrolase [Kineosporiaceae bacterium]|nr:alpha/beta fold hydrolase [Kineosporiaceae bacterium]